jgi:iron complex transport system ATP-binding protein
MLSAVNISFKINGKTLLHDTSLSFESNRFHVIMGANGAGKSTLLKLLAGSLHCSTGNIFLHQEELNSFTQKELALKRAVLSQHYNITFPITANDIVMMGRYPYFISSPLQHDHDICTEAMQLLEADDLAERDYNTLSGGEAQKIQMSRVLAQIWEAKEGEEKILFLDEPVSHLDIKYQHQLLNVAKVLCQKHVTVIAILHDINLALTYADRILFMKQGKICYETRSPKEVTTTIIKDIFDIEAGIIEPGNDHRPVVVF